VTRLVRGHDGAEDASVWDPRTGRLDQVVIDRADAVVNLSGSPMVRWPPTASYRRETLASRIDSTTPLARAVAASESRPALISASGMSYYGSDRGDEILTESSAPGDGGVLPEVVHRWESATEVAADAGARVCRIRTTAVMHRSGGVFPLVRRVFGLGLGAKLGSGQQYMSMLSLPDWIRAATTLIEDPEASGAFNFGNPNPVTNAEFTDAVGRALGRPTVLVAPSFVLRAAAGSLANELLGSLRVQPGRLTSMGFTFEHPDVESVLVSALT
jgi:uncharacterized protein (TIGR01777 family)